jgi:hypothetical protein
LSDCFRISASISSLRNSIITQRIPFFSARGAISCARLPANA